MPPQSILNVIESIQCPPKSPRSLVEQVTLSLNPQIEKSITTAEYFNSLSLHEKLQSWLEDGETLPALSYDADTVLMDGLSELMLGCWARDKIVRPSFAKIERLLQSRYVLYARRQIFINTALPHTKHNNLKDGVVVMVVVWYYCSTRFT